MFSHFRTGLRFRTWFESQGAKAMHGTLIDDGNQKYVPCQILIDDFKLDELEPIFSFNMVNILQYIYIYFLKNR